MVLAWIGTSALLEVVLRSANPRHPAGQPFYPGRAGRNAYSTTGRDCRLGHAERTVSTGTAFGGAQARELRLRPPGHRVRAGRTEGRDPGRQTRTQVGG